MGKRGVGRKSVTLPPARFPRVFPQITAAISGTAPENAIPIKERAFASQGASHVPTRGARGDGHNQLLGNELRRRPVRRA